MKKLTERYNTLGRLIKKYKNMARTANKQRKWQDERNYTAELKALQAKREQLREEMMQSRPTEGLMDPRVMRRINVLLNEIARDERILAQHKANNNQAGINKYEAIVRNKKQQLARLQNRPAPAGPAPSGQGQNNNRRIRILLNELNRDKRILAAHQQNGNAAGVAKYQQIVKQKLEELARLRSGNSGPGGNPGTPNTPGTVVVPQTPGVTAPSSRDDRDIANKYRQSGNHEHAYRDIINSMVKEPQFVNLAKSKDQLYVLNGFNTPPANGSTINQAFIRDCIKIMASNIGLKGITVIDGIFDTPFPAAFDHKVQRINALVGGARPALKPYKVLAHRDAFQLIPQDRTISPAWSQFAGAMLKDISLQNIRVQSQGSLQGIFSSDGSFQNLQLRDISVTTQSAHGVAILGLMSGTLDLSNTDGSPQHVELLPLRLGGYRNNYVIGFSARSSYQYGQVSNGNSNAVIKDNRQKKTKTGKYYTNFDMDKFIRLIQAATPVQKSNQKAFLDLIESSAALSGDLVV